MRWLTMTSGWCGMVLLAGGLSQAFHWCRAALIGTTALSTAVVSHVDLPGAAGPVRRAPRPIRPTASLALYPTEIHLTGAKARQQVIAVGLHSDGVTDDVTPDAQFTLSDPTKVRLDGHTLIGLADGATTLTVHYAGRTASTSINVAQVYKQPVVSFKRDVMPVFMRGGCNTGSCHGSARGQDGFRLSLFGFDPDGDYQRLTRELVNRRINLAEPRESLLLEKATGTVQHTGGKRFAAESEYYGTLLSWLEAGAPADPGEVPKVEKVELYPPSLVLEGKGATQQMAVRATYADGTQRDVTALAVFLSNNDNSAAVSPDGLVTSGAPGESFVMARFSTHNVGTQVLVLPAGLKYTPPAEKPANYIDELVGDKLRKLRITPAGLCSDETFLRRVTLDMTGLPPTLDDYQRFLDDRSAGKRAKLIDHLLERKEFTELWAMMWAEVLMVRSANDFSYKSTYLYWTWISEQFANNVPIDQVVREMLTASGGTFRNPATNFYQVERDTLKTSENVAQSFMGIRIQCAQCHNHPFDRWTMDDYYGFDAFFSQIGRKPAEDYRETIVFNRANGETRHPVGGRVMPPKFLGGATPDLAGRDRREALAQWLTSPENPFFANSIANRAWVYFFGTGIVEPVDDLRVSNPPSNRQLLEALGRKLVEYKYDLKRLVRDICNSHAYQRAVRANGDTTAERNFAQARIRRLRAEILQDTISQVTDTKDKFRGLPLGGRAVQIADGTTATYFLTTFGRTPRETVCACDVHTEPTLSQALHLLNGETVENKLVSGGLVARLLAQKKTPEQIIAELYVRCLSRQPDIHELGRLSESATHGPQSVQQGLQDVFWALLNSREFLFNH